MKVSAAKFLIFFVVLGQIFGCTKSYKEQDKKLESLTVSQAASNSQYEWYELQIVQWWKARIEYANKINRNNNRPTEARYISVRSTRLLGKSSDEEFGIINPFVVLTCGVSEDIRKSPTTECLSEQDGKVCWQDKTEFQYGAENKFWILGRTTYTTTCGQKWSKKELMHGPQPRESDHWMYGYNQVPPTKKGHFVDRFVIRDQYNVSTIEYTGKTYSERRSMQCLDVYYEVRTRPKEYKVKCVAKQDVAEGLNAGVWGPKDELRAFILASHIDDWSDSVKINLAKGLIAKGITRDMARAALGEPKYNETKTEQGQEKVIYQYGAAVDRVTGEGTARLTFIDDKLESWEEQFPTSGSARRITDEAKDNNFAVKLVIKTDESARTAETRDDFSKKLAIAMSDKGSEFVGDGSAGGYGRIHGSGSINTSSGLGKKRERIVGKIALGFGSTTGHCDKNNIEQVVRRRAGAMRACYEEQLQNQPTLEGKITARWTINLDGTVKDARIAQSSIGNKQVENCLLRSARMMRFAKPVGGTCIVQWPFVFSREGNFSSNLTANTRTVKLNDLLQKKTMPPK